MKLTFSVSQQRVWPLHELPTIELVSIFEVKNSMSEEQYYIQFTRPTPISILYVGHITIVFKPPFPIAAMFQNLIKCSGGSALVFVLA